MGMSATQARLLTITGRLTDNEMRSQTITNAKLRLAQKSSDASQVYMDALSSEKLVFKSYDDNGAGSSFNLTPALLYSYEPLKNQYSIQNASGQNLVSATDANNFETSNTLSQFLDKYGLAKDTTDADKYQADMTQYKKDLDVYEKAKAEYDEKMNVYLEEYQKWLEEKDKPDLYGQFTAIVGTSTEPQSCYRSALYGVSGAGCYVHVLAHLIDYKGGSAVSQEEYTASNGKTCKFSPGDVDGSAIYGSKLSDKFAPLSEEISKEDKYCDGDDNCYRPGETQKDDRYDAFEVKENIIKEALDAGKEPSDLEILKSDYVYDIENKCLKLNEKGEPQLKTIKQKAIDLLYILKNNLITSDTVMKETLVNFTDGDMKNINGPEPEKPELDATKPEMPKAPTYDFAVLDKDKAQWYINLWYMMNGSTSANKLKDEVNTNGETIYTTEDNLKSTNTQNYKVIDDQLLTSSDWLTFALKNGVVTLSQASYFNPATDSGKVPEMSAEGYYWNSTVYSSTTDIVSVEDEVAIAKAEVKYKNTTTEIENQDKKYDQDLKKLDTEHSALQTEYESLKSVIDKNVERSFKAFS